MSNLDLTYLRRADDALLSPNWERSYQTYLIIHFDVKAMELNCIVFIALRSLLALN